MPPRTRKPARSTDHDVDALALALGVPLAEVASVYDGPTGPVVATVDGNAYTRVGEAWHIIPAVDGWDGPMPVLPAELDDEDDDA